MVDTVDTRRTTDDRCRTTPRVWHKLPTCELKTFSSLIHVSTSFMGMNYTQIDSQEPKESIDIRLIVLHGYSF